MIIVRLLGGLGNQMFQYATGRALALRRGTVLKLDLSAFAAYPLRSYRLDHFRIDATLADTAEVARVTGRNLRGLRARIHGAVERRRPYYRRGMVRERRFGYDPKLSGVRGDAYLVGFWQSERYFDDIRDRLVAELTVSTPPEGDNRRLLDAIEATDSISLHVRRGDYVEDPANLRLHGTCPPAYYERALAALLPRADRPHVFVFSDDIGWAKEHLRIPCPATFVAHNGEERDYEDLRLMSRCRHHVIANSTFSWWGAWLSTHPDRTVVAPREWFRDGSLDARDVVPDSWLRV
ncbi:MAG TPA: alpha-1,2-fucosyltransferase [Longimicrobiaceae bacterium]|nr:alpha-1,2-fucosyltransferase [Longimicrobiaceae bacterium]